MDCQVNIIYYYGLSSDMSAGQHLSVLRFGVTILRGSRSPLLADSEILALCRWGIRDGLYIIPLLGFTVVLPNLQRDLGLIFSGVRD
ncbi:MAG: hypothetical protein O4859_22080, partial [Trichodesmium sp. St18_bin1]|nr:hypothetical protein [Trichodesmium sp. St18_bin1]